MSKGIGINKQCIYDYAVPQMYLLLAFFKASKFNKSCALLQMVIVCFLQELHNKCLTNDSDKQKQGT